MFVPITGVLYLDIYERRFNCCERMSIDSIGLFLVSARWRESTDNSNTSRWRVSRW